MTEPVGHPGGFYTHLRDLAVAVRARDWGSALSLAMELVQMVKDDVANDPRPAVGAGPDADADALADALDQHVPAPAGPPATFGAIPWALLAPLILKAVELALKRLTEK